MKYYTGIKKQQQFHQRSYTCYCVFINWKKMTKTTQEINKPLETDMWTTKWCSRSHLQWLSYGLASIGIGWCICETWYSFTGNIFTDLFPHDMTYAFFLFNRYPCVNPIGGIWKNVFSIIVRSPATPKAYRCLVRTRGSSYRTVTHSTTTSQPSTPEW